MSVRRRHRRTVRCLLAAALSSQGVADLASDPRWTRINRLQNVLALRFFFVLSAFWVYPRHSATEAVAGAREERGEGAGVPDYSMRVPPGVAGCPADNTNRIAAGAIDDVGGRSASDVNAQCGYRGFDARASGFTVVVLGAD